MNDFVNIFTDGGSRGNPGEGAIGVYITYSNNNELTGFGKKIGISTNNVAEYKAVLEGLDFVARNKEKLKGITKIYFFLDSLLVYSQIVRLYRVKDSKLKDLLFSVWKKEREIETPIFYKHIPREENKKADMYVNRALDSK